MKSKSDYQQELENEAAMIALDDNSEGDDNKVIRRIKYLIKMIKKHTRKPKKAFPYHDPEDDSLGTRSHIS